MLNHCKFHCVSALLFGTSISSSPRNIGAIDPFTDVFLVAKDAYESAKFLCDQYYMTSPEVDIKCVNGRLEF